MESKESKTPKYKESKPSCFVCSRKLDLAARTMICKCSHIFCSKHRQAEVHNCSYDFKTNQVNKLEKDLLSAKSSSHCKIEMI
jgi:AN1-type zinc finger and ubiquitin domain-containing protein 1